MSSGRVIAIPGKALPDREMRVWNPSRRAHYHRNWRVEDRPFQQVRPAMSQRAVAAGAGHSTGDSEHILAEHTPISDQGNLGTCSANAWMDAFEILLGLERPTAVVQLSRLFVYWTARVLTGTQHIDSGAYLRAVAHQLRKIGVVEERYMPYRDQLSAVLTPPALDLYTMASNNRIHSFYRIVSQGQRKLDDIELAVRANHPVISAAQVDRGFVDYRGGGTIFGPPTQPLGPHAMIITGVRRRGNRRDFLRRNSWGAAWGDNGHVWCDEAYVRLDEDIWVGTQLKPLI